MRFLDARGADCCLLEDAFGFGLHWAGRLRVLACHGWVRVGHNTHLLDLHFGAASRMLLHKVAHVVRPIEIHLRKALCIQRSC